MTTKRTTSSMSVVSNEDGTIIQELQRRYALSDQQSSHFLFLCKRYGLNFLAREVYPEFSATGDLIPVVTVDGWAKLANDNKHFDGLEFTYSNETQQLEGAKACPCWCEVVIYRNDRTKPIRVREYLDEVYMHASGQIPGHWQTHTKRQLRHKAFVQGCRLAFGLGGIFDSDEALRIKANTQGTDMHETDHSPDASVIELEPELIGKNDGNPAEVLPESNISDDRKEYLTHLSDKLIERARSLGSWEVMYKYAGEKLQGTELKYVTNLMNKAEQAAGAA